jgi:hypothetical protein
MSRLHLLAFHLGHRISIDLDMAIRDKNEVSKGRECPLLNSL